MSVSSIFIFSIHLVFDDKRNYKTQIKEMERMIYNHYLIRSGVCVCVRL